MSSVYKSAYTDLNGTVSFGGRGSRGGGGSRGGRKERRDNAGARARQRQAEIDAGTRRGISTTERAQAGVTAAGTLAAGLAAARVTGPFTPKVAAASVVAAAGTGLTSLAAAALD